VFGLVEVFGGMFVNRTVAAAYVSTLKAEAEVDPLGANFQTVFAALRRGGYLTDCVQVGATHGAFSLVGFFKLAAVVAASMLSEKRKQRCEELSQRFQ